MGLIWEKSFWAFFFITVGIGGGAGWAMGRAQALRWRPYRDVIFYACLLGAADRFLHWGLFLDKPLDAYKGTITSLHYYTVDTVIIIIFASIAYRMTQAGCMTRQYRWMYRRTSPFTWTNRKGGKNASGE